MRILILGSGGREHALFLKISKSPLVSELYIAPGNGGIDDSQRISIDVMDFGSVLNIVKEKKIGLLVVGPEGPLAEGIKDFMEVQIPDLMVFGPDKRSAQLEASKVFSYKFMEEAGIPTAKSSIATNLEESLKILKNHSLPVVIKADGLAAGKGVSIHFDKNDAMTRCDEIFTKKIFGESGNQILIQEYMTGKEASLFAICNGREAIYLPTACDYKRVFDNSEGPNTGGMGSFSPGNILKPAHIKSAHEKIVQKVINEFHYTGILYTGLMLEEDSLNVVEFNCRLGDPETQSVLPMMESDIVPYLMWSCGYPKAPYRIQNEGFNTVPEKPGYTINVVLCAKGYPAADFARNIILKFPKQLPDNVHIVHAGTRRENEIVLSSGGRIASVVAYDKDPGIAREKVYAMINELKILNDFSNLHYRLDIGR